MRYYIGFLFLTKIDMIIFWIMHEGRVALLLLQR